MNCYDYIKSELLILMPVLYLLGIGLKKSKFPDKRIPMVLGVVGVILAAVWVVSTERIDNIAQVAEAVFTSATQGVLVASGSVYVNQLFVQAKKEE